MKKFYFFFVILVLLGVSFIPTAQAADLSAVSLSINPQTSGSQATWTISFTIPQDTKIGHILISLGGYPPSLSSAELFVSGIPNGNPQVGKSNPNCVFNCDDIRYYYTNPVSVKKGAKITFTLNKVQNSSKTGETGINFINVYSSKYPQTTLAFFSGAKLVNLISATEPEEPLLPPSATTEDPTAVTGIAGVMLNELFFQPGAKTTKFDQIKDAAAVSDLTLDLLGKEKVVFKGVLDLSKPEAVKFFQTLGDYLTFDKLSLTVNKELLDYFKAPLEVTYYDLPFVWDPDLLRDDTTIISKDKIANYHYVIYDNKPQVSFSINEAGKYQLIPHLELNIQDNQKITSANNVATFSGRISDPKAQLRIDLNGLEQQDLDLTMDQSKGEFTFKLSLNPGANLIEVSAKSEYGDLAKISKIVEYVETNLNSSEQKTSEIISPFNIAAVVLAVLAIILLWIIKRMAKKRR